MVSTTPADSRRRSLSALVAGLAMVASCVFGLSTVRGQEPATASATAEATTAAEMKPYTETIRNTNVTFEMLPIPGGSFVMGSPATEADRQDDEGPQHEVKVGPFWMGKHEVTWDEYDIFVSCLDAQRRRLAEEAATPEDTKADAMLHPTRPYTDMTFGMGKDGFPAICMTQFAAKKYCEWLSAKTGHFYRLPTEAEWEYACRAGSTTAYSFGDDASQLDEYAWCYNNTPDGYQKVGLKKPNPWGLHDMHGNVTEWCADQYVPKFYETWAGKVAGNPLAIPTKVEPGVVRGGSWDDDPDALRSAARRASDPDWKQQDPQLPQSIWYYTDALWAGFRIVRPLDEPMDDQKSDYGAEDKVETNVQCE